MKRLPDGKILYHYLSGCTYLDLKSGLCTHEDKQGSSCFEVGMKTFGDYMWGNNINPFPSDCPLPDAEVGEE